MAGKTAKCIAGLLAASALLLGEAARAQEAVDAWKLHLGKEFPGAHGNIYAAPGGDGVCLEGFFGAGGNYVAMIKSLNPPLELKEIRLKVKSADVNGIVIRITDSTGQTHSQLLNMKEGSDWQTISVKKFADGGNSNSWGGANDGKWHGPAKSVALLVDKSKLKSQESPKGVLQLSKMELIPAP